MSALSQDGYQIHRKNFCADEIAGLRQEADRVSAEAGAACVRKLLERSRVFADLAIAPRLKSLLADGVNPVRAILFDKTREEN